MTADASKTREALEWYGEIAMSASKYMADGKHGDALLALLTELSVDGGKRASAAAACLREEAEPVAWRCFHCDETFADEDAAARHFGRFEDCTPACRVGIEKFREMEAELQTWRSETDHTSREFYALGAEHNRKQREAEQAGYDRGIADARAHPETLGLAPTPSDERQVIGGGS